MPSVIVMKSVFCLLLRQTLRSLLLFCEWALGGLEAQVMRRPPGKYMWLPQVIHASFMCISLIFYIFTQGGRYWFFYSDLSTYDDGKKAHEKASRRQYRLCAFIIFNSISALFKVSTLRQNDFLSFFPSATFNRFFSKLLRSNLIWKNFRI